MKRYLYLIRHATAEDNAPMFRDFDRELTTDGIMDAARLGGKMLKAGYVPERLVASGASRTYQTAKVIAEQLRIDADFIESNDDLYDGGPRIYIAEVARTHPELKSLALVGHNPDISYFADYLTKSLPGSMEKGCLVVIEFEDLEWNEISGNTGVLKEYVLPR